MTYGLKAWLPPDINKMRIATINTLPFELISLLCETLALDSLTTEICPKSRIQDTWSLNDCLKTLGLINRRFNSLVRNNQFIDILKRFYLFFENSKYSFTRDIVMIQKYSSYEFLKIDVCLMLKYQTIEERTKNAALNSPGLVNDLIQLLTLASQLGFTRVRLCGCTADLYLNDLVNALEKNHAYSYFNIKEFYIASCRNNWTHDTLTLEHFYNDSIKNNLIRLRKFFLNHNRSKFQLMCPRLCVSCETFDFRRENLCSSENFSCIKCNASVSREEKCWDCLGVQVCLNLSNGTAFCGSMICKKCIQLSDKCVTCKTWWNNDCYSHKQACKSTAAFQQV
jgi:hypothetical protein